MSTETPERILPEYPFVLGQEMSEAIGQAIGAASVCWEPMDGTGVFQSDRAKQIADELMGIAVQYAQAYPDELRNAGKPEGQWLHIGFFGRIERQGYVTEITIGGQPVFHIDLPEKIWDGNPHAWEEYAASALHSRRPLTEESVRKAWEAEREAARRRAAQLAEWKRQQRQYALEAADEADADDDEDDEPEDLTGAALYEDDDETPGPAF